MVKKNEPKQMTQAELRAECLKRRNPPIHPDVMKVVEAMEAFVERYDEQNKGLVERTKKSEKGAAGIKDDEFDILVVSGIFNFLIPTLATGGDRMNEIYKIMANLTERNVALQEVAQVIGQTIQEIFNPTHKKKKGEK